jgi:hypothetical protein
MRTKVVVEALPFFQLLVEINIVGVIQQLIKLDLLRPMRPLHLSVQSRRPHTNESVIDAEDFHVPVKFGLELMSVVGADSVHAERELIDKVVDERDGMLLIVPLINFERANASLVVDGCGLVTPHALA